MEPHLLDQLYNFRSAQIYAQAGMVQDAPPPLQALLPGLLLRAGYRKFYANLNDLHPLQTYQVGITQPLHLN